jgi:hypothetical protein
MTEHDNIASPKRLAAFYGRVSGRDGDSLETQLLIAREFAAADGFVIPDDPRFLFTDYNVSGKRTKRSSFDRLQEIVESPAGAPFDRVYVRDRKRLGRWKDPRRITYYAVRFEDHGVEIRFCDQKTHVRYSEGIDDSDTGAYLSETVDNMRTSRDHAELVTKFRRRKRELVKKGFYPGPDAPFGYAIAEIDPDTGLQIAVLGRRERTRNRRAYRRLVPATDGSAEIVRWIFEEVARGSSLHKIVFELSEQGTPTASKRGQWHVSSVSNLVHNEIYMGTLIWGYHMAPGVEPVPAGEAKLDGPEPILYEGFVENPLIPAELFQRVQIILSGRAGNWDRRRACNPKYLLTGRLSCAECGLWIYGQKANEAKRRPLYYIHTPDKNGRPVTCRHRCRSIGGKELEAAILEHICSVLQNPHLRVAVQDELARLLSPEGYSDLDQAEEVLAEKIRGFLESESNFLTAIRFAGDAATIQTLTNNLDGIKQQLRSAANSQSDLARRRSEREAAIAQRLSVIEEAGELSTLLKTGSFADQRAVIERVLVRISYNYDTSHAEIALKLS